MIITLRSSPLLPGVSKLIMQLAGLLTYPSPERLPVLTMQRQWLDECSCVLKGLTAAGTISDFHAIPYYSFVLKRTNCVAKIKIVSLIK